MSTDTTIETFPSRTLFDYAAPTPAMIHIEDIAHHLATEARFANATGRPWVVAAHSLLVADLLRRRSTPSPRDVLRGLLHDAAEYVLRDLPGPLKRFPELAGYRKIEARVEAAIIERFDLGTLKPRCVKEADDLALIAEQVLIRGHSCPRGLYVGADLSEYVNELYMASAPSLRLRFLRAFEELREAVAVGRKALAMRPVGC